MITVKHFQRGGQLKLIGIGVARVLPTILNIEDIVTKNKVNEYEVLSAATTGCTLSGDHVYALNPITIYSIPQTRYVKLYKLGAYLDKIARVLTATLDTGNTIITFLEELDTSDYDELKPLVSLHQDINLPLVSNKCDLNWQERFSVNGNPVYYNEFGWVYVLLPRYSPEYPLFNKWTQPPAPENMSNWFDINPATITPTTVIFKRIPVLVGNTWPEIDNREYQLIYRQGVGSGASNEMAGWVTNLIIGKL